MIEDNTPGIITGTQIKRATIEAIIIRADGTQEKYGIVSGYDKNIFKHIYLQISIKLRRVLTELRLGKYFSKHR